MESTAPATHSNTGLSALSLQSLLESARLLNSSLSRNEQLSHLLRSVMGRLLVTRAAIAVEQDGVMQVALARGVPGLTAGAPLPEHGVFEHYYPIGAAEKPIGMLAIGRPMAGKLSTEQEELLQALLEIAATALANARAHEETVRVNRSLDQSVQELRAILDLARGLAAETDPEQIAHLLALTLAGRWTVRKHAVTAWREGHNPVVRKRGFTLPESGALREIAAALGEVAYTSETLPAGAREALGMDGGSAVFPIRSADEIIGLVMCGPRAGAMPYSANDLEFGAGLIAQVAVAFENAWRLIEILAQKQMEQELAIAAGIQESLFPARLPVIEGTDLAAKNRQARHVGGDYYDVLPISGCASTDPHLLCVADISGKGLPAALLMANIQATLRATIGANQSLSELAVRVNALLYASTPPNRFATGFLLGYDPASGEASYVNAGHTDGIVFRKDGSVELLTTTGMPLGMFAKAAFEEARVTILPGDLLMLYSDGVNEAENLQEDQFGLERITCVLQQYQYQPVCELVEQMVREIDAFAGAAPQHDDITLMVLRRLP